MSLTYQVLTNRLKQWGLWRSDVFTRQILYWLRTGDTITLSDGSKLKTNKKHTLFFRIEKEVIQDVTQA